MKRPSKVRVVFDHKVLNKYQRSEGLECSWVSLKPNIRKISDLQCHVQKRFSLDKKCPNGVVLYIDDFILPPFESTCMLNESDIISVKRKENAKTDSEEVGNKPPSITEAGENSNSKKRNMGIVSSMHKENGIDTVAHLNSVKKKKHSDEIPSLKKDEATAAIEKETAPPAPSDWQLQTQKEQETSNWNRPVNQNTQNYGSAKKWNQFNALSIRIRKRNEWSDLKNHSNQNHATNTWSKWSSTNDHNGNTSKWDSKNRKAPCNGTTNGWSDQTNNNNQNSAANNWDKWDNDNDHNGRRSNWSNKKDNGACKGTTSEWSDHTDNSNKNNSNDHNGHKSDWSNKNDKEQCIGTTSGCGDVVNNKGKCSTNTSKWDDACIDNEKPNEMENAPSNEKKESSPIDFESLFPLTRVPRVGDLIAYRLIEMSPSWCPSVTPFRIGEVTSYSYLTLNIVLVQVPDYPVFTDEKDHQKSSQYKDDGTLEIHYTSLIDVRLFKPFDLSETSSEAFESPESEKNSPKGKTTPVDKWEKALTNEDSNANENENEKTDLVNIQELAFTIEHSNAREKEEEKEKTDAMNTWEQTLTIEHNNANEEEKEEEKETIDPVNKWEQALASEDSNAKEIAAASLENENAIE